MLVEVKIQDIIIVVPCSEEMTVADVSSAAVKEFLGFNLKKQPQKVLYTRDSRGRVLSSALFVIKDGIDPVLETVVTDFSGKDSLGPNEAEKLYRDWQAWTVNQIKETITSLAYEEIPPYPEDATLNLLFELCRSPNESIQLSCVKVLQTLLTKFSHRDLIIQAAQHIRNVFSITNYADVAIAALNSFKGLSPLQARVFNSAQLVQQMFDVERSLLRFSPDKRGKLLSAFEAIAGLLDDESLHSVIRKGLPSEKLEEESSPPGKRRVHFVENEDGDEEVEAENEDGNGTTGRLMPSTTVATIGSEPKKKRINFKRLESLLASEDRSVRRYALEKLLKLITTSAKAHFLLRQQKQQKSSPPSPLSPSSTSVVQPSSSAAPPITTPASPPPYELQVPLGGPSIQTESNNSNISSTSAEGTEKLAEYAFEFQDAAEVDSIVKCLFRTLKVSIHARPHPKRHSKAEEDIAKGTDFSSSSAAAAANFEAPPPPGLPAITATSTAGRLIQTALQSHLSDEASVCLVVDCLWQLLHFPVDISLAGEIIYPIRNLPLNRRNFVLNGLLLSNIQLVFLAAGKEWYRLLLTLAQADEGSRTQQYGDMAEKCAYMFILVALHGMQKGWRDAECKVEEHAVLGLLDNGTTQRTGKSGFRVYVALSFIMSCVETALQHNTVGPEGENGGGNVVASASPESSFVERILTFRNCEVAAHLWKWSISADKTVRKSAVMALHCLAHCLTLPGLKTFLYKQDPMTKLAALLPMAVRDERLERVEFAVLLHDEELRALSEGGYDWEGGGGSDFASASGEDTSSSMEQYVGSDEVKKWLRVTCKDITVPKRPKMAQVQTEDPFAFLKGDGGGGLVSSPLSQPEQVGGEDRFASDSESEPEEDEEQADSGWRGESSSFRGKKAPAGDGGAGGGGSLLDRIMNKAAGDAAAALAKEEKKGKRKAHIYPDIPLIRLTLKSMYNLLMFSGAKGESQYNAQYRGELANWLYELEISSGKNLASNMNKVKLRRIARKDQVVSFYFNLLVHL